MSPMSFKMACRMFDPKRNYLMIFETAIISCTVLIMCPEMSFIAARNKNISAERPMDDTEAIADIFKRMDEIQERLEHERRQRKKLAEQLIER